MKREQQLGFDEISWMDLGRAPRRWLTFLPLRPHMILKSKRKRKISLSPQLFKVVKSSWETNRDWYVFSSTVSRSETLKSAKLWTGFTYQHQSVSLKIVERWAYEKAGDLVVCFSHDDVHKTPPSQLPDVWWCWRRVQLPLEMKRITSACAAVYKRRAGTVGRGTHTFRRLTWKVVHRKVDPSSRITQWPTAQSSSSSAHW